MVTCLILAPANVTKGMNMEEQAPQPQSPQLPPSQPMLQTAQAGPVPRKSHSKKLLIILTAVTVVIVTAIAGYLWWRTRPAYTVSGQREVPIVVDNGKISGDNTFTFKQNEPLAIKITSKNQGEEEDFVIPGYQISTTFSQNSVGNVELVASKKGSFPIYLHDEDGKETQIGKVIVQ
jgi:hypothetical protein